MINQRRTANGDAQREQDVASVRVLEYEEAAGRTALEPQQPNVLQLYVRGVTARAIARERALVGVRVQHRVKRGKSEEGETGRRNNACSPVVPVRRRARNMHVLVWTVWTVAGGLGGSGGKVPSYTCTLGSFYLIPLFVSLGDLGR